MNDFEIAASLLRELFHDKEGNRVQAFCGFYFIGVIDNSNNGTDLTFKSTEGVANFLTERTLHEGIQRILEQKQIMQ